MDFCWFSDLLKFVYNFSVVCLSTFKNLFVFKTETKITLDNENYRRKV